MWNKWQHTKILLSFRDIHNPVKQIIWRFLENSQRLNTVNYFCKKLHFRCFTGSEYVSNYRLWIRLWIRLCFFYNYFQFESIKSGRSGSQISFKIDEFKNFAIFTGKNLCWSPFVVRLLDCKPANLLKRVTNTSVFLWTLQNV